MGDLDIHCAMSQFWWGFQDTTDVRTFESKADEAGEVAQWTFGIRQSSQRLWQSRWSPNSVTSAEAMPMHYGGFFFHKKEIDENGIEKSVPKVL